MFLSNVPSLHLFQEWLCLPGRGSLRMISGGVLTVASTQRVGSLTWYLESCVYDTNKNTEVSVAKSKHATL